MKRLAFILALLLAAPALAQNTAPVRRDVQATACGGTTPASCPVDLGLTNSDDLIVLCSCGQELVIPEGGGWTLIASDSTGANTSATAYYKIASDADEAAGQVSVGYETGGNYEMVTMISWESTTFNPTSPIGDDKAGAGITTTGSGAKSFNVGSVAVQSGEHPAQVVTCYCGSDNGSGGTWASGYTSTGITTGWDELSDHTTTLGRDGAQAVAAVDAASPVTWGSFIQFTSAYSMQYSAVTFLVAGAPPPPTSTNTPVNTNTPTPANTPTITNTATITPTPADTATATATGTITSTPTITNTPANTHTSTATRTGTATATATRTNTATNTATATATAVNTATITQTFTPTATPTITPVPKSWFERSREGDTFRKSSWTLPEADGFMSCFKPDGGVTQAIKCIGATSPVRYLMDSLGRVLSTGQAPHTIKHNDTLTSAVSGRVVTWGVNPDWHPPLIDDQLTPWTCLKSEACQVQGSWDFDGADGPKRNSLRLPVGDVIRVMLRDVPLNGIDQFWMVTGQWTAGVPTESIATQGCDVRRSSITSLVEVLGSWQLSPLPANCNLDFSFTRNGTAQDVLCTLTAGESRSSCAGDPDGGFEPDDSYALRTIGDATCATSRDLLLEVSCASASLD